MHHLSIVETKNKKKPPLNPLQRKFNQLQKQLETLQQKHKDNMMILDKHLSFHTTHIQPLETRICDLLKVKIKNIYKYADNRKIFSKLAKRSIFGILSDLFYNLHGKSNTFELDEELSTIFKQVEGSSYEDMMSEASGRVQEMVEELLSSEGLDVDLTGFDYKGSEEEILQRLFKVMAEQAGSSDEKEPKVKSKRELEKEQREDQLENLQKKGLNSLYKRLAKAFHPDLELDPKKKTEKESLMKQLTLAYEENDLHTLLSLEMQWMKKADELQIQPSSDQLNHYNKILQDQVSTLKKDIANVIFEPQYFSLRKYFQGNLAQMELFLTKDLKNLQKNIRSNETLVQELQGSKAIETIRNMVRKQEQKMERDFYL
ncbi:MAG: hypothetical protein V4489_05410 [Chlamydiota bacterium]